MQTELSNRQLKILKSLYPNKQVNEDVFHQMFKIKCDDNAVKTLYENKLLRHDSSVYHQPSLIFLTEKGRACVEDKRRIQIQYIIPTAVSVIALVKAFDKEILWLWKLLMQLLR